MLASLKVIIAEYLGMPETLIYNQTWVGGVTLSEFEELKKEVEELKELVNTLSKLLSNTPKNKQKKSSEKINENIESDRLVTRIELNRQ